MYRRRRKFKGSWVPTLYDENTNVGTGDTAQFDVVREVGTTAPADGTVNVQVGPIAIDNIVDTEGQGNLLNDAMQGGWALRRIVGKFIAGAHWPLFTGSARNDASATGVQLTLGFFVARTEQEQDAFPIGTTNPAILTRQYNPQHPLVSTEPWIWRRTWILGNRQLANSIIGSDLSGDAPAGGEWVIPPTNVLYGSVSDGPHIDAKTRRRIQSDERLWFATACRLTPTNVAVTAEFAAEQEAVVSIHMDLRFFGALRRKRNRSAF